VSGDVHARFCEGPRGKFPRSTHRVCAFRFQDDAERFVTAHDFLRVWCYTLRNDSAGHR
jgi:hypothetical protein